MAIGDDQISYIFGGNTGLTYEQLKRRRAVAQALASQRRGYPKNVGEGLTYLGESFGDLMAERRLDAAEKAMSARGMAALNPQLEPPMTAPVAPPPISSGAGPPGTRPPPVSAPPRPPPAPISPQAAPAPPPPPPPSAQQFGPPAGGLTPGYAEFNVPSGTGMTPGLPSSDFAAGGLLSPAPLAAPSLDAVLPEGGAAVAASNLPSSGYLPPAAAAAPPSLPRPPVAATPAEPINFMDYETTEWPVGTAGRPTAPDRVESLPSAGPGGRPSPELLRAQEYQRSQGRPATGPTGRPVGDAPGSILGPQSALTPRQRDIVARTIYGEASNQADVGQQAVANVILNRARMAGTDPEYEALKRNQFEPWWNAKARARMESLSTEHPAYQRAQAAIDAALQSDPTGGATHFYSPSVQAALGRAMPSWDRGDSQMIGTHKFLRLPYGGQQPAPAEDQGGNIQLASYAPSGGAGGAPIPGMGGAGSPRLGGPPPVPGEQVTPTDIEPMPSTAQFGGRERFVRTDAPPIGVPPVPAGAPAPDRVEGRLPMAGQPVSPAPLPLDPGPEPRMSGPTPTMQHYRGVAADPAQSDSTRAIAQSRYEEELRAQREGFKNHWLVWKTEKLKFDDPATRIQLEQAHLNAEKTRRDLEGEGFRPLTPAELAGLPKPPEGQIIYANRRGELKFGPTPPASTTVNVDTKATGKGQEKLQEKMAEQFVEMFTAGNTAADDLRTVTEMRELATRVGTGPQAVAKQFAGRWGIKTEGISDIEVLNAMINRVIPTQRMPGTGAPSDFDSRMFQQAVPGLMNTPGGNALIMDTMENVARNKMARSEVAGKVISGQLTVQEGVKETLALQGEARALSDRVKAHIEGRGATPSQVAPGAPIRVQMPEDASRLPSGTRIILPDGSIGRVP